MKFRLMSSPVPKRPVKQPTTPGCVKFTALKWSCPVWRGSVGAGRPCLSERVWGAAGTRRAGAGVPLGVVRPQMVVVPGLGARLW